ncbi:uncharacterized protein LOC120674514 isoform X2 [Panicum virgatum]|uniref:uncharacterized protein LOC120674514 isoform X2 n=1 Tax=Panicum virgatum TaxID=38727 RepID=UPI0019D5FD97|nr:uncharacterized protein LOC120674514 isoform X2 [Panicum virgatum]XP_039811653.1 uncharacterized protein LOC120674514 isoform X2 [Panicum virgatum]
MAHTTGTTPSQACGCSYLLPHPHMRHDQAKKPALARAYREETLSQFLRRRGRRQAESRGSARQEEEGWRQRRAPQTSRGRRQAGAAAAVLHCQAGAAGLTGRRAVGRGTSADGGTRHPRHCTAVGSQSSLSASSPSSVAQVTSPYQHYIYLLMNLKILKQNASLALRELQCLYCATLIPVRSTTLDLAYSMCLLFPCLLFLAKICSWVDKLR